MGPDAKANDVDSRGIVARLKVLDRTARRVAILIVGTLTGIWVVFAAVMHASYREHDAGAERYASDVAALLSADLGHTAESFNLSLRALVAALSDPMVAKLPRDLQRKIFFDDSTNGSAFGAMLVTNSKGILIEDSRSKILIPLDVSDRDYFRAQRDDPSRGLYLSHPFLSRLTGQRMVGVSLRLEKNGRFDGVAVGTLQLDSLRELFRQVQLPPGSLVAVRYDDGSDMISVPEQRSDAAANCLQISRPVSGLPLKVVVTIPRRSVFATFWRDLVVTAVAFGILTAVILLLGATLVQEWSRRNAAEARLRRIAGKDGLTGLANRRRFDEVLRTEATRAARQPAAPLSLVLVDVDCFKSYNDTYGHPAGDEVLRTVATMLEASATRATDFAARIGGEEFALVLPDTSERAALDVAERFRQAVHAARLPHEVVPHGCVTVSVGIAGLSMNESATRLFEMADAALYRAKAAGRNCCEGTHRRAHSGAAAA